LLQNLKQSGIFSVFFGTAKIRDIADTIPVFVIYRQNRFFPNVYFFAVVKKPANYHWTGDYSNFVTSDKTFIQIPSMYQYSDMSNQPVKSPGRCLNNIKITKNHIKKMSYQGDKDLHLQE
jgi:hypothetical protein